MKKYIPNIITIIRLLLIPVFIWAFFMYDDKRVSLAIFLFASMSDLLDGYLARKWNVISDFGKLADPIADKALQLSALVCLTVDRALPLYIAVIVAAKELLMILGGLFALKKLKFTVSSNSFGKFASFFLSTSVCLCFFKDIWFTSPAGSLLLSVILNVAVLLSISAMVQYGIKNIIHRLPKNIDEEKEE